MNYETDSHGIITSPGKFEGEMRYVPWFWEAGMNGLADRDDGKVMGFDISPADKVMFPELKRRRTVKLIETDQGFVCEI